MNIDDLTIKQARELVALFGAAQAPDDHPYPVGANVFIRSVTMHYTGKLVRVTRGELVLDRHGLDCGLRTVPCRARDGSTERSRALP